MGERLRIGTRGSPLALAQAREVAGRLAAAHPDEPEPEIVVMSTTGDRILDRPLAEIGGKGLFTRELEDALHDGTIDLAVHSMKDVPTELPDGLVVDCTPPREDPRDVLIPRTPCRGIDGLARGAVVGTASLRRQAQLLCRRPDLKVETLRGNIGTRLRKLEEGVADATLLAVAGLRRLGMADRFDIILTPDEMMPAVAQGAIGIERRARDTRVEALLSPLHDEATGWAVVAERALLAALDGSCRMPIAALATIEGTGLTLAARVLSPDGARFEETWRTGDVIDAERLGLDAGLELRARGADFLDG